MSEQTGRQGEPAPRRGGDGGSAEVSRQRHERARVPESDPIGSLSALAGPLGSLLRSWFENFLLTSLPLVVEVEGL